MFFGLVVGIFRGMKTLRIVFLHFSILQPVKSSSEQLILPPTILLTTSRKTLLIQPGNIIVREITDWTKEIISSIENTGDYGTTIEKEMREVFESLYGF